MVQSATSQQSDQKNGAPTFDEQAPIGSIKALHGAIERWKPQLDKLAPKGRKLDMGRFAAVVLSCASRTPKVLLCSYYSLRQSVQAAAELGLELGGVSGEAFIVPFENRKKIELPNGRFEWVSVLEATFIPGYKGYLRLAYESGLFRDLGCDVILPDDTWEPIRRGPEKLQWGHVQGEPGQHPALEIKAERWEKGSRDPIEYVAKVPALRGAYAFAKLKDPQSDDIVKPIWRERLETIRLRSKAGKNGPWITDYHEMARKTAVRNLWKHLPKSDAMKRAEELDQEFDLEDVTKDGRERPVETVAVTETPSPTDRARAKTDRVAERVASAARGASPPTPPPSSRPAEPGPPPSSDGREPDGPDYDADNGP